MTAKRDNEEINGKDCERFCSKVNIGEMDECWEWTKFTHPKTGYASFSVGHRTILAHRFAYEIANGEISEGLLVRHSCDNRKCCNPRHLLVGTHLDNAMDRVERGRSWEQWGEKNPIAKLKSKEVIEIRKLYAKGNVTQSKLAMRFHVDSSTISRIITGDNWPKLIE